MQNRETWFNSGLQKVLDKQTILFSSIRIHFKSRKNPDRAISDVMPWQIDGSEHYELLIHCSFSMPHFNKKKDTLFL